MVAKRNSVLAKGAATIFWVLLHAAQERVRGILQQQRLARPKGEKLDLELYGVAVSTINGCELCVRMHADAVVKGGLSKGELAESVRIAATLHATAVALSPRV